MTVLLAARALAYITLIYALLRLWGVQVTNDNLLTVLAGVVLMMGTVILLENITVRKILRDQQILLEKAETRQAAKDIARKLLLVPDEAVRWEVMAVLPGDLFHETREALLDVSDIANST